MIEDEFLRDWPDLKHLILDKWNKVTPKDLAGQPSFDQLVDMIHTKYPKFPRINIIQELTNLSQQMEKE